MDHQTNKQWLSFVDPKGIKQLDINGPKFSLYTEIKNVEKELNDTKLILNAFILSVTPYSSLLNIADTYTKPELEDRHVLFMDKSGHNYLKGMLERMK